MSKKAILLLVVIGVALVLGAWYYGRTTAQPEGAAEQPATSTPEGAAGIAAPTFATVQESRTSPERYCTFMISYPQARIAGNAELEEWFNRYLRAQFVPSDAQLLDCERGVKGFSERPITETTNISYNVKLATGDLVSLTYTASSYFEGAAHPANRIAAYTIDLANRTIIPFEGLLRANSDDEFDALLYAAVAEAFTASGSEPYFDQSTFYEQYTRETYDFYLTRDALVVVNLFDIHAIQGLEASIPFFKLKPHINPQGILMRLVSQDA
jgi:hypothetical protein